MSRGRGRKGRRSRTFLRVGGQPPTWELVEPIDDLESLSVATGARGMGMGTELIEHCRNRLWELGAKWWNVTVVAANERAVELYEREGFRPYSHNMLGQVWVTRPNRPL